MKTEIHNHCSACGETALVTESVKDEDGDWCYYAVCRACQRAGKLYDSPVVAIDRFTAYWAAKHEEDMAKAGRITIEDMIREGSCTARWAMMNGYLWECVVDGGDALRKRERWLAGLDEDAAQSGDFGGTDHA